MAKKDWKSAKFILRFKDAKQNRMLFYKPRLPKTTQAEVLQANELGERGPLTGVAGGKPSLEPI